MKKILFFLMLMLSVSAFAQEFQLNAVVDQIVSCYGNNDGFITAEALPSGQYTYSIRRYGEKTSISNSYGQFNGLKPGTYFVTAKSPQGQSKTVRLKMTQPDKIQIKFTVEAYPWYSERTGAISIDITGGVANLQPYLTTWLNVEKPTEQLNDPLTNNFSLYQDNLSPGLYRVIVEDDQGCFASRQFRLVSRNVTTP